MPRQANSKKWGFMFSSLLMCCLSASLLTSSFATEYWFVSDSELVLTNLTSRTGTINFGLFKGMNEFLSAPYRRHTLHADGLEFMDYGLWVGTIACLSAGLLMAVVGALFAVVNTATTPVEAITGVPGLYLWNGLAAIFDMITVILWAVQFHKHLSSNVLLYDSSDGWTTEGMEMYGYSFWLVVVAIFVHVANIAIIAIGTYEPKKKTQLETPDSKGGNIMLY